MKHFYKKCMTPFFFTLFLCSCFQNFSDISTSLYIHPEEFKKIEENIKRKKTKVGVILYSTIKNTPHLLFIKYRKNSQYDIIKSYPLPSEKLKSCALRILKEATSGLYTLKKEDLSNAKIYYEKKNSGDETVILMIATKEILHTKNLRTAQEFCKNSKCYISKALKWISVKRLFIQDGIVFINDDGSRTFFDTQTFYSMQQPAFKQVLHDIKMGY